MNLTVTLLKRPCNTVDSPMGASTSYEKVKFFFHCVRQIAPDFEGFGHYPMDDNTPAPAEAWNAIRDAVKERVRVYRQGWRASE